MEDSKQKKNLKRQCKEDEKVAEIKQQVSLKKVDDDEPLGQEFFEQEVVQLAKDLLGKVIVRNTKDGVVKCMIVETEAYKGSVDKACHAFGNKKTERTKYFWLPGGHVYMFSIYGSNYCMNIVAGKKDEPEAVLLRAVEPIEGIDLVQKFRNIKSKKLKDLTNGPGKLTQAMQIDKQFNGYDLRKKGELYLIKGNYTNFQIEESKRINIDYAEEWIDKLWRFTIKGNQFVSV